MKSSGKNRGKEGTKSGKEGKNRGKEEKSGKEGKNRGKEEKSGRGFHFAAPDREGSATPLIEIAGYICLFQ